MKEGRPFTETLTTTRFRMTTALKSLYVQIEMPADTNQRCTSTTVLNWTIDFSGTAIPIEQSLTRHGLERRGARPHRRGQQRHLPRRRRRSRPARTRGRRCCSSACSASRRSCATPTNTTMCNDHASKPYFTADDVYDWAWVTIAPKASAADRTPVIQPYDLPALRTATTLSLSLPRYGFYTTPAFLALWNTNDSNQHRVTANQTLLVALGQAFTAENTITPFSAAGLDSNHAVAGSECVGCHADAGPDAPVLGEPARLQRPQRLPGRQPQQPRQPAADRARWSTSSRSATCAPPAPAWLTWAATWPRSPTAPGLPRFGISVVQQLCFYANSSPCSESDPEFRRIVGAFKDSTFNFAVLAKEFFSSPLVDRRGRDRQPPPAGEVPISIARRDHLCAALSNRLASPTCARRRSRCPARTQTATGRIAASVAADAFSRGAESPVTPTEPTMFYRAATEMLCENIATQVVDATAGTVYTSTDIPGAINGDGGDGDGLPARPPAARAGGADPDGHQVAAAVGASGSTSAKATVGLRSAFALACESPRALGIGL